MQEDKTGILPPWEGPEIAPNGHPPPGIHMAAVVNVETLGGPFERATQQFHPTEERRIPQAF